MHNFGRRQGVNLYRGEAVTQVAKKLLEPLELQIRMEAALHQQLRTAMLDQLPDLGENIRIAEDVSLWIGFVPIECTEFALRGTNVGVVDIAIDNERDLPSGMHLTPQIVGQSPQLEQIGFGQQPEGFRPVERRCRFQFLRNRVKHFRARIGKDRKEVMGKGSSPLSSFLNKF